MPSSPQAAEPSAIDFTAAVRRDRVRCAGAQAPSAARATGVTLIEMIAVIVILGVLALFAAPRFFAVNTFAERGFYDDALAATRYAQKLAVASGCNIRIHFDAGYALFQACGGDPETAVPRPGSSDPFSTAAPVGIAVEAADVTFDRLGRPLGLPGDNRVSIGSRSIGITPETGFVQ